MVLDRGSQVVRHAGTAPTVSERAVLPSGTVTVDLPQLLRALLAGLAGEFVLYLIKAPMLPTTLGALHDTDGIDLRR
jgi:hypothetical protein